MFFVTFYVNLHKDEKKYIVKENTMDFIKKLLIHIPDGHFHMVRYYGYYSNKSHDELNIVHKLLFAQEKNQLLYKLDN